MTCPTTSRPSSSPRQPGAGLGPSAAALSGISSFKAVRMRGGGAGPAGQSRQVRPWKFQGTEYRALACFPCRDKCALVPGVEPQGSPTSLCLGESLAAPSEHSVAAASLRPFPGAISSGAGGSSLQGRRGQRFDGWKRLLGLPDL